MAGGKRGTKRAAFPYIEREAQVEGDFSGDELAAETATVDLTNFEDDSALIDSSANSHRALEASRRKKARKSEAAAKAKAELDDEVGDGEEEKEEEEDAEMAHRRELLRKLKEAKQESKAIQSGNITCKRVRCPLCHSQMSESTSEEGETYLWCPNKCNLPYKPSNEKARYLGELSVRLNAKFVNPNHPPDCKHGETAALIHLNSKKVKAELQDTLFFICPKKVAEGRCDFVAAAEEEDELEAEFLETLYRNRNEKINRFAEDNRKVNENSFELGLQAAKKAKEQKNLFRKK